MWLSIENTWLLFYILIHPCKSREELLNKFENSSLDFLIKNKYVIQTGSEVKKDDIYIGIDFFYKITRNGIKFLLKKAFIAFILFCFSSLLGKFLFS
ncbi:hypothetical protein FUSNEC_GEN_129_09290 [Fusobacterium necrophorum subsp. funduliforme]|uniref:hypothetical protein n=1 Tax=Fusobacterium necrophorum TaxID=859 RepID=UPI0007897FDF|nr:hypothetical protein [Fusobacterium necrophorum]KYM50751.1 hypothetical protein A2U11_08575 [Fusobacterium necrophorum subsp. funduliforme]